MKTAVTQLQELGVKMGKTPVYDYIGQTGPLHNLIFKYRCSLLDVTVYATARSKKEAKQEAARLCLVEMSRKGLPVTVPDTSGPSVDSGSTAQPPDDDSVPSNGYFEGPEINPFPRQTVPENLVSRQKLSAKDMKKGKSVTTPGPSAPGGSSAGALLRALARKPPPVPWELSQPSPDDSFECRPDSPHPEDMYERTIQPVDSGPTSSSGRQNNGERQAQLDALTLQLQYLLAPYENGIWASDLYRLYREKFGRLLRLERYGFAAGDMGPFVRLLEGSAFHVRRPTPMGDWRLYDARAPLPSGPTPPPASRSSSPVEPRAATPPPPPAAAPPLAAPDRIPPSTTAGIECGDMFDVLTGQVYSPSHFWLLRHDNDHISPLYGTMDAMTHFYESEGFWLTLAAETEVRVGVYCAALYDGDWHRAVVVAMPEDDEDVVVVRYVDYGTVRREPIRKLKPLLRRWRRLPEQAVRARLAGLMPPDGNRHWQRSSTSKFLELVSERPLVADVAAVDHENNILEVFLVNTSTEEDVCINSQLCSAQYAEQRRHPAFGEAVSYLWPTFEALETGATPEEPSRTTR